MNVPRLDAIDVPNVLPTQFGVVHACVELSVASSVPGLLAVAQSAAVPNEDIVALHDVAVGARHEHPAQGVAERFWLRVVMSV